MYEMDLLDNTENVNKLLARYGVKFGIYKNNTFKEQLFPGVCQDYAHIMIALCRIADIPCRYVVGMMQGRLSENP